MAISLQSSNAIDSSGIMSTYNNVKEKAADRAKNSLTPQEFFDRVAIFALGCFTAGLVSPWTGLGENLALTTAFTTCLAVKWDRFFREERFMEAVDKAKKNIYSDLLDEANKNFVPKSFVAFRGLDLTVCNGPDTNLIRKESYELLEKDEKLKNTLFSELNFFSAYSNPANWKKCIAIPMISAQMIYFSMGALVSYGSICTYN